MSETFPNRFLAILPASLAQEAPYPSNWGSPRNFSNTPGDPGGATMMGIIQTEYDTWRVQHHLPRQPVRKITEDEGDQIYYSNYYLPYCPELPVGLDQEFFDTNVNEGVGESIRILQVSLGIVSDGIWGPQTDKAVKGIQNVPAVIKAFAARRAVVYTKTRGFTEFGRDWLRRTTEIETASMGEYTEAVPA